MKTTLPTESNRSDRQLYNHKVPTPKTCSQLSPTTALELRAYNKFLLAQVFRAAAPENVRKLLSHKDQTRMTVDDAYDTFFTDHRVETDKKERAMVNVINDEEDSGNASTEQDIAAFRPQQRQQQQRYSQQQNSNYRSNQNQQQKGKSNKNSYPKKPNSSNY